jgi:hypothetical protein
MIDEQMIKRCRQKEKVHPAIGGSGLFPQRLVSSPSHTPSRKIRSSTLDFSPETVLRWGGTGTDHKLRSLGGNTITKDIPGLYKRMCQQKMSVSRT